MRKTILFIFIGFIFISYPEATFAKKFAEKVPFIIEVDGDPHEHKESLERTISSVEIINIYEQLLKGIALKVNWKELDKMSTLDFIINIYPAITYEAPPFQNNSGEYFENIVIPKEINPTSYTGKNVKIGVIDTGIDYEHGDLSTNYAGGYDVVDLDDDPMETVGINQTKHGTHVAGIISANGSLQGVAPDAEIYGYRALGPGGIGSSIHIIAALEQALIDGVEIVNLSLGNTVNGPDYPTSIAVNRAIELGMMVVIANGNSGPSPWTVGAPATASQALSVGAMRNAQTIPYLYERFKNKVISLQVMQGSIPWHLDKDYPLVTMNEEIEQMNGKIAITSRGEQTFYEKGLKAQEMGAMALLIANDEEEPLVGNIEHATDPLEIPVAAISKQDGEWLRQASQQGELYVDTCYEDLEKGIASFSSRGPVTLNWQIKPEILAPGENILSTVPGGEYEALHGTSMAAPHVSGAIAVIKEANPEWDYEQISGALQTTAQRLYQDDQNHLPIDPIDQGMGVLQIEKAIQTKTIIHNPILNFGKMMNYHETNKVELIIENVTDQALNYTFNIPKKQQGLTWQLPLSFEVAPKSKKTVPIGLNITTPEIEKGIYQGWLTLNQAENTYHLPYLLINQSVDIPKITGFEISPTAFSKDKATYQFQMTTDDVKKIEIHLYNAHTLFYERKLLKLTEIRKGFNQGEITKKELGKSGMYQALISVEMEDGLRETSQQIIWIE